MVTSLDELLGVIQVVPEATCFQVLVNYSQGFSIGISKIVAPWTRLTRKGGHSSSCIGHFDGNFNELKTCLSLTLELSLPFGCGRFTKCSDACGSGLG